MPKYYVSCGDLRCVVDYHDAKGAAIRSLSMVGEDVRELDHMFDVNEVGFESHPDFSFSTEKIIIEAGWEFE